MNTLKDARSVVAQFLATAALTLVLLTPASATLLGVRTGLPNIVFGSLPGQGLTYSAATGALNVTAVPYYYQPTASTATLKPFSGSPALQIAFDIGPTGVSGTGTDFVLNGTVDTGAPSGPYTGTLLTGSINKFGYLNQSATTDAMDFVFSITGGSMMSLFGNQPLGVIMSLENSSFDGSFSQDFASTRVKGIVGPVSELVPPESTIPAPATPLLLLAGLPLMMRAIRKHGRQRAT